MGESIDETAGMDRVWQFGISDGYRDGAVVNFHGDVRLSAFTEISSSSKFLYDVYRRYDVFQRWAYSNLSPDQVARIDGLAMGLYYPGFDQHVLDADSP